MGARPVALSALLPAGAAWAANKDTHFLLLRGVAGVV